MGLPAHLGPLPLSKFLPCCVTLGESRSLSGPSNPPSSVLKNTRGKGALKTLPLRAKEGGATHFFYISVRVKLVVTNNKTFL